jgi:endonuclease/exonuclease/phosphatase family metal-dependent hydrolase
MQRILLAILIVLTGIPVIYGKAAVSANTPSTDTLRVMSFNIWVGGGKSLVRTAAVIRESRADIVGIQEGTDNAIADIVKNLGWPTIHIYTNKSRVIVSKYPIVDTLASRIGVKLRIDENKYVWMLNLHLNHCPYEPYRLNGIEYCGGTLYTEEEAIASAWNTRKNEVELTVAEIKKVQAEQTPVFLTGDFNEPSYLDWTKRSAKAGLCKIPVAWPSTKKLQKQTGMRDSYRVIHPDEVAYPGYTWTPVPAKKEVLDRIDFVFFWGNRVNPVKSEIVGEKMPESDVVIKDYPSDHRAVLSTFQID